MDTRVIKQGYNAGAINIEELAPNEERLDMFFRMIYNRQMIWIKRFIKNEPFPWTDDEILSKYKFCNLYREHDRSSQWEIKNIILDDGLTLQDLVWKIMVYRTFNNPETFARAVDKWQNGIPNYDEYDQEEFSAYIESLVSQGLNPFTSAYSISGNVQAGQSISSQYTCLVLPTIHRDIIPLISIIEHATSPEQIISFLMTLPGISSFMAHEYYQDFTYISVYTNRDFMKFGQNDYTNKGPGSAQGAKLLFENLKSTKDYMFVWKYLQSIAPERLKEIGELEGYTEIYAQWDKESQAYDISDNCNLSLNQIEGALCEFSKYYRLYTKTGNPKCPEFSPRTLGGLIVERSDKDQTEFITEEVVSQTKRGRGRPRKEKDAPKSEYSQRQKNKPSDFVMTLNINLNITKDGISFY